MSTSLDVEKAISDEENHALLRIRSEGRPDDEEHPNRADDMELADLKQPDPSSTKIANDDDQVLKGTNESEELKEALRKLWDMNTSLLNAIYDQNNKDVLSLLENGANPNATCPVTSTSACHIAAFCNEVALRILLDAGAERRRLDTMGNTPLHYATWANSPKKIAMILDFPEGLTNEVTKVNRTLTPEQEAEIQETGALRNNIVNNMYYYICDDTGRLYKLKYFRMGFPVEWRTNDDVKHNINVPNMLPGHSALHVASATANPQCVRLLLAAGADPSLRDQNNSTPLDVAGVFNSDDYVQTYVETLQLLLKYGGILSEDGRVLEAALRKRSLQALKLLLDAGAPINQRNPSGYTPMHLCVMLKLKEHLEILANHSTPEMDFRAVDVTDEEGSTVLLWAARERWSDGVTVALSAMADITHENSVGDTALHLATKAGDYDIVKKILEYDLIRRWDIHKKNVNEESPLMNAILSGHWDIVRLMLSRINATCAMQGGCVHQKVGYLASVEYEKNFHNFWELITKLDNHDVIEDFMNFLSSKYDLHKAIKNYNRGMINVSLQKGADLSQRNEDGQTAIYLLMYHITKPTEFMTEILDKCIELDKNIYDKDCVITINYSLLMPDNENKNGNSDPMKTKATDMKVLEALIETGDVFDQRSLLTHPVIESFLYLKWKKCAKFIYFLILAYVLFLISLNTFIATVYYHMDHKIDKQDIPLVFNPIFWRFFSLFTLCVFSLVDIFYWSSSKKKWLCSKTIWVKLFLTVGGVIMICIPMDATYNDIIRGVSVTTVSLSWIYLMIYLSWTPTLGYYMQMYGKVSRNVMKVMLSFSFPLVGFSICFMILLRCKEPFDDPIAAFLKTMVMMSSEFEYENLVKNTVTDYPKDAKNSNLDFVEEEPLISVFMLRIFFMLFLICVAIVLMNLMLGVAVSDYQELSHDGKQRRLMKQVECISALEKLFQQKPLSTFNLIKMKTMKFNSKVKIQPDSKIFGTEMKEIIFNKAQSLIETEEKRAIDVSMKAKIDDIFDLTKKLSDLEKKLSDITKSVHTITETIELKDTEKEKTMDEVVDRILEAIAKQRTDGPIV